MKKQEAVELQRRYYRETAARYDTLHLEADAEHEIALAFMAGVIDQYSFESVLDLGSGTGRVIQLLHETRPGLKITGIEPVEELRQVACEKGVPQGLLISGDANDLDLPTGSYDLVCAFGLLHHVPDPGQVVDEMLRVSRRAVFISDSNNFGQGSASTRLIKQIINAVGLWPLVNFLKTGGRGYIVTDGDGISYSYSVFNNYRQIAHRSRRIHLLDTRGGASNLRRQASHLALFALK